jgi:hypothetical protein
MIQTREAHINDDTEAHIGSTFSHSWKKMIKTERIWMACRKLEIVVTQI